MYLVMVVVSSQQEYLSSALPTQLPCIRQWRGVTQFFYMFLDLVCDTYAKKVRSQLALWAFNQK